MMQIYMNAQEYRKVINNNVIHNEKVFEGRRREVIVHVIWYDIMEAKKNAT